VNYQHDIDILRLSELWKEALVAAHRSNDTQQLTTVNASIPGGFLVFVPHNYTPFVQINFNSRYDDGFYYRKITELNIMAQKYPNQNNLASTKGWSPAAVQVTFYYRATSFLAYVLATNQHQRNLRDALSGRKATFKYPLNNAVLKDTMTSIFRQYVLYRSPAYLETYGKECQDPENHFVKANGIGCFADLQRKKTANGLYTVSESGCTVAPGTYMLYEHYLFLKSCGFYKDIEIEKYNNIHSG
jgi:hypothetical protein